MSEFLVSARKYRPTSFEDVVGQSSVTSTLKNAIQSNQLAQSYLFCGPRGVGKTTCARIFAKEINKFRISRKTIITNSIKDYNNTAMIYYTSGSTGVTKGTKISHYNYIKDLHLVNVHHID